jgi:hypothetical protein
LHENVGLAEHGAQQLGVLGFLDVEDDRFLAAIQPDEIGALAMRHRIVTAREIAGGPFDLDHARARVRQT